ncbi:hypothetical protein [Chitinimonas naiadis]
MFTPLALAQGQQAPRHRPIRWQRLWPTGHTDGLTGVWSLDTHGERADAGGVGIIRQTDRWLACLHGRVQTLRPVLMLISDAGRRLLGPSRDGHYVIPLTAVAGGARCYLGWVPSS